ncbi:MAG: hypothetical protein AB1633_00495, partial [Elusimicrobiota bacterium]
MFLWTVRVVVILAGPFFGYLQISRDMRGLLIGLAIGVTIVALEFFLSKVPLDTLVAAGIGTVLGFVVASLMEYGILSLGNEKLT